MRTRLVFGGIVFLLLGGREAWLWTAPAALHVLDVGQGDALLLTAPGGVQALIDGGPDATVLEQLPRVMPLLDRTIDLVVLTHPDRDHLAGLRPLLNRYRIGRFVFSGVAKDSGLYRAVLAEIRERSIPTMTVATGDRITLPPFTFDVFWPPPGTAGTTTSAANDTSVVLRAHNGATSVLLTGDISTHVENVLVAAGFPLSSTILKVPHHGSHSSSSTGFLLAVDPDLALLSSGRGNRYGHPHRDILARYAALGIPVRNTQEEGRIDMRLGDRLPLRTIGDT